MTQKDVGDRLPWIYLYSDPAYIFCKDQVTDKWQRTATNFEQGKGSMAGHGAASSSPPLRPGLCLGSRGWEQKV